MWPAIRSGLNPRCVDGACSLQLYRVLAALRIGSTGADDGNGGWGGGGVPRRTLISTARKRAIQGRHCGDINFFRNEVLECGEERRHVYSSRPGSGATGSEDEFAIQDRATDSWTVTLTPRSGDAHALLRFDVQCAPHHLDSSIPQREEGYPERGRAWALVAVG